MIKKQALVILLIACLLTIQSSYAVGPAGMIIPLLFKALGYIPFFPKPSSPTCWVPEGHAVKSALIAAATGNYQNALAISGDQVLSAASRCWFGQTPANLLLEAAQSGDMDQAYGALEELFQKAADKYQNSNTSEEITGDNEEMADPENQSASADQDQTAIVSASSGSKDQSNTALKVVTNHKGETPLHLAAGKGNIELVTLLLEKGAPVNVQDTQGMTPLMNAAARGHLEIIHLLVEHDADINKVTKAGISACMLASHAGHTEIVNALIDKNCDVNAQKQDGATALMLAARNGRFEIVKSLVAAGADVNRAKKDGWTALMLAAFNNRLSITQFLIEHGADTTAQDHKSQTALDLAKKEMYLKVAQLFGGLGTKESFKKTFSELASTMSSDEKAALIARIKNLTDLPPDGHYHHSCRKAIIEGNDLVAECMNKNGIYKQTQLRLPCEYNIDNDDGNLVCVR